jgi:predicted ester cyclase
MEAGWQRPDAEAFRQLHAPGFVDHCASGRPADREGFWGGVVALYAAFPDLRAEVEDMVVEAGRGLVAIRWTAAGTHRGRFLGVAPTGKPIRFAGIEIIRIEAGLVVERWGEWNGLELLEQLRGMG